MKRAILCLSVVLGMGLLSSPAHAVIRTPEPGFCPAARSNQQTPPDFNLAAVMHLFRDHLNEADSIISQGRGNPLSVSNDALKTAYLHVGAARNCALYVAAHADTTMMPSKALEIDPAQLPAFLAQFRRAMIGFSQVMGLYQKAIVRQAQLPVQSRDFSEAYGRSMDVREYANQAHRRF